MQLGTGIGIAIRGQDLEIVCARARLRKMTVTGFCRIESFRSRPVLEVAESYHRFRRANHAETASAVIALPRAAGLIRTLELPAEVGKNLHAAISYQIDSLHPFGEGGVYYDYAVVPLLSHNGNANGAASRLRVSVAIVEKQVLDSLYHWFSEAGIDVGGFTFATAGMYQLLVPGMGQRAVVLVDRQQREAEVLGVAPDGAFCSREISGDAALDRELERCASDLRLKPEATTVVTVAGSAGLAAIGQTEITRLEEGLLSTVPETRTTDFRLGEHFAAYGAAVAAVEQPRLPFIPVRPGLRWNLLPPEKRVYRSHWAQAVARVLAVVVAALAILWASVGSIQDRLYSAWLDNRIRALQPRIEYLEKLDSRQRAVLDRVELLDREHRDIGRKLDAVQELTRLLPQGAWLQSLQFAENQIQASGVADSASAVLQAVNSSPYFEQAEFGGAIARNTEGKEIFQIRMRARPVVVAAAPSLPVNPVTPAPAASTGNSSPPSGVPPAGSKPPAPAPGAAQPSEEAEPLAPRQQRSTQ